MERKNLIILVTVQAVVLALLLATMLFFGWDLIAAAGGDTLLQEETVPDFTEGAEPSVPSEPTEPTAAPTEPTEAPTEPQPQSFTLTFVGDCTFGCQAKNVNASTAFPRTVGEDYAYPMANVLTYFESDDYTFANLEGVLGSEGTAQNKKYVFRGSAEYTRILTENSIEGVTIANNHSYDYGEAGYAETKSLLESAGVDYVENMSSIMVTTDSGLTIGIFAASPASSVVDQEQLLQGIRQLKEDGAELIVCAIHWGVENTFQTTKAQRDLGHAIIDAGANIVWGHHPHVLQPIEEYNGGIIYYSLGNFAFGGNSKPKDFDTALLQQEVIRELDGSIRLGELTIVPCSVSSIATLNNYQPTPYEEGTKEYDRVLTKLDGTYQGGSLPIG